MVASSSETILMEDDQASTHTETPVVSTDASNAQGGITEQLSTEVSQVSTDNDTTMSDGTALAVGEKSGKQRTRRRGGKKKDPNSEPTGLEVSCLKCCQLMLPEPLKDLPADFTTSWATVPVPPGTRCFVVSSKRSTAAFRRNGRLVARFPSALPNGSNASLAILKQLHLTLAGNKVGKHSKRIVY